MHIKTQPDRTARPFLLLLTLLSIPFYVLGALVPWNAMPIKLPLSALMAINPLIAAVTLTYRAEGMAGVRVLLHKPFVDARIQPVRWYFVLVLLMPILIVASYGLTVLTGRNVTDPQITLEVLPIMCVVFAVSAYVEEIGWQGYLFAPLHERLGLWGAGAAIGTVWAVWHTIPFIQTENPLVWVVWQSFFTIVFRMVISWAYTRTGDSIFAAILLHATYNVAVFMLPNGGSAYDPMLATLVTLAALVIVHQFIERS